MIKSFFHLARFHTLDRLDSSESDNSDVECRVVARNIKGLALDAGRIFPTRSLTVVTHYHVWWSEKVANGDWDLSAEHLADSINVELELGRDRYNW